MQRVETISSLIAYKSIGGLKILEARPAHHLQKDRVTA